MVRVVDGAAAARLHLPEHDGDHGEDGDQQSHQAEIRQYLLVLPYEGGGNPDLLGHPRHLAHEPVLEAGEGTFVLLGQHELRWPPEEHNVGTVLTPPVSSNRTQTVHVACFLKFGDTIN